MTELIAGSVEDIKPVRGRVVITRHDSRVPDMHIHARRTLESQLIKYIKITKCIVYML